MRPSRSIQRLALVFVPLLCGSWPVFALDSQRDLSRYGHDVWLTENGLPQNTVHSIAQTSDGYIWIGTEAGLARFDGVTFTIFDKQNTPQMKGCRVIRSRQSMKIAKAISGSLPLPV